MKDFISSVFPHHPPPLKEVMAGTRSRSLEAGTEAEDRKESAYWLVLYGLLSLLSHTTRAGLPRGGTTHSDLSLPPSHLNHTVKKMPPTDMSMGQLVGGVFSVEVPSYLMTLAYV